jgi:hypothetical protein
MGEIMSTQLNLTVPQGTQINLVIEGSSTSQGSQSSSSIGSIYQGLQTQLGSVNINYGAYTPGQAPYAMPQSSGFAEIYTGPYAGWLQGSMPGNGFPGQMSYAMPQSSAFPEMYNSPYASWLQGGMPNAQMGGMQPQGFGPVAGQYGAMDNGEPVAPGQPGSENRTYREFADPDDPSGGPAEHRDMVDQYGYVYTWDPDYGRYEACGQDDGQGDLNAYSDEEYCSINKLDQQTPGGDQAGNSTCPGNSNCSDGSSQPYPSMPPSYPPNSTDSSTANSCSPDGHGAHQHHHHHHHHDHGSSAPGINIDVSDTAASTVNITISNRPHHE